MTELLYRIALTKIPKVGAITAKNLISYCGSAEAVFKSKKQNLILIPNIGEAIASNILHQDVLSWAEKEIAFIEKHGIKALVYTDPLFPQRLKVAHDCPALLYYKGTIDLNHGRVVSIVGTRKPTAYGTRMTELFTEGLSKYNVLITSGLAFGVDVAAHRKSVEMGIPTIGVMGSGLQKLYPSEHRDVARRMCENGGLLTEYPSDQEPDREHFPMRNRIIAGMCDALVVIETGKSGGSMITAHMALGYEREVYAIPGRAGDKTSAGCNYLIKTNKAALIESADDFAEMMRWDELDKTKSIQTQLFTELGENEQVIMKILQQSEGGVLIDALSYQTQLNHSAIASLLLTLEFKGLIRSLPGKRYALA
jgi:DNA processing protein